MRVFKRTLDEAVNNSTPLTRGLTLKCRCGYETSVLFVLAKDKIQADTKFEMEKGLCANCLVDLIIEKNYEVCSKKELKTLKTLKLSNLQTL